MSPKGHFSLALAEGCNLQLGLKVPSDPKVNTFPDTQGANEFLINRGPYRPKRHTGYEL